MPWINTIDEQDATGELGAVYQDIKKRRGKISNIMRVHSLNPAAMQRHLDLYIALMFGRSGLSREDRELIGVVVSHLNGCEYCVQHHAAALDHYWENRERIAAVLSDSKAAGLNDRQQHMLAYVRKLTVAPDTASPDDILAMRKVGLTDADILNINLITGYFCLVNRTVLGLGVDFTESEVRGYEY
jgi:uncharacterized peroxidase-related enzyme